MRITEQHEEELQVFAAGKGNRRMYKGQMLVVTADPYNPESESDRVRCQKLGSIGNDRMMADRPFWHLLGCNLFAAQPEALKGLKEAAEAIDKEDGTNDD